MYTTKKKLIIILYYKGCGVTKKTAIGFLPPPSKEVHAQHAQTLIYFQLKLRTKNKNVKTRETWNLTSQAKKHVQMLTVITPKTILYSQNYN